MPTETSLLRKATLTRVQAQKCRDLISVIKNAHAIAVLQDYALELDRRALQLEREAAQTNVAGRGPGRSRRAKTA